jgi:ubiquinol-cytochrome c reductase cytochrome b subunit
VLRATTADFIFVLMAAIVLYVVFIWIKSRLSYKAKIATAVIALILLVGMLTLEAKFWGVVLFGSSVVIIGALPWLDHSPVRSIRYRPNWHMWLYVLFGLAFVALGYLGTQLPTPAYTMISQVCTLLYFSFFLLMPWWSAAGRFKPVPTRVTFHPH